MDLLERRIHAAGQEFVVLGDWNEEPDQGGCVTRALTVGACQLMDAPFAARGVRFKTRERWLDYGLASPTIRVLQREQHEKRGSDHGVVTYSLSAKAPPKQWQLRGYRRLKYTPTKESLPEWRAAWSQHRDEFDGSKVNLDVQSAYDRWVQALEEIAEAPEGEGGTRCQRWQLPKIVRRRQRKPQGPRGKLYRLREQLMNLRRRPIDKRLIEKAARLLDHFRKRGAEWASSDRLHDEGLLCDVEAAWKEECETTKVRNLQSWHARMDDDDELLRWVRDTAEERPAA